MYPSPVICDTGDTADTDILYSPTQYSSRLWEESDILYLNDENMNTIVSDKNYRYNL